MDRLLLLWYEMLKEERRRRLDRKFNNIFSYDRTGPFYFLWKSFVISGYALSVF
jgi:hypothetical protein